MFEGWKRYLFGRHLVIIAFIGSTLPRNTGWTLYYWVAEDLCCIELNCVLPKATDSLVATLDGYCSGILCMGYWPSVRSRWLDIGQVLFWVFMDRDEVEVHKLARKRTRPISSHLDRTNLVNKGYYMAFGEILLAGYSGIQHMNKGSKFLKKLWCCVGGSITR